MDINSLLSPTASSRSVSQTPADSSDTSRSPFRRTSSGPKSANVASPLSQSMVAGSNIPTHVLSPRDGAQFSSSPANSPLVSTTITPPVVGPTLPRNDSTPSMDTLADLASMQNHQPPRFTPPVLRSRESYESQLSPSTIFPNVPSVPLTSNPRPSIEGVRMDSSRSLIRTDYSGTSLPLEVQQQASFLAQTLQERPSAFVSHTQLINILHRGFVDHVYPPSSPHEHGDPHTYSLLQDLRAARENMHKLFAMGEDLWMDCLRDESMLARNNDERITVTNKCLDAIAEEHGSVKLWKIYGDWILHCYNSTQERPESNEFSGGSEEDRLLGQATFTWDLVMDTWQQAVENTKWRLNDSHIIWNQYIDLLIQKYNNSGNEESAMVIRNLFEERLRTPHANWDETFQTFSSFISNSPFKQDYELIMVETSKNGSIAKAQWSARDTLETALQSAQESGNGDGEYMTFAQYIQWELTSEKRRRPEFNFINAIYQRAELRFPSDASLWEDHILWLIEKCPTEQKTNVILSTLERATRHCPWSGSLWSQYLLTSEKEQHPFSETENIKHKATSTGLLDVSGIEEVLKVHVAWCGYLRRRAFRPGASDEDLDIAEMGIRSSIENVQQLACKLDQKQPPDPQFQLERIYINFLSNSQSWDSAKEAFQGLIPTFGNSYEFWLRFYEWEMIRWRKFVADHQSENTQLGKAPTPQFATAVLKDALKRPNLDQPEQIMNKLIAHCEDYEDVDELQQAIVEVKKAEKTLRVRREKDFQEQQTKSTNGATLPPIHDMTDKSNKRKREETESNDPIGKRPKKDEVVKSAMEEDAEPEQPLKRDREHASIIVRNLPREITDNKLRQFFRDCGTIYTVKVLHDQSGSAIVEFEDQMSAEYSLSRSGRELDGMAVEVQLETKSTLYVTNYPPAMGQNEVRDLFQKYGEIVDIRLPSLKANAARRFCYIQFKNAEDAERSLEMDGLEIEPGYKLNVYISDPDKKQERSGPTEEGRQLFIRELAFKVSEKDLEKKFSKYGTVETVKIPQDEKGRSKGYGFVTFSSAQEAEEALVLDGQEFKGRAIQISIARKPNLRYQATVKARSNTSPAENGDATSPTAMSISSTGDKNERDSRRDRTIAIVNVPDTVNATQIRSIAERHGTVTKVTIQPAHQGAILEYNDSGSAGKAALALEGFEIFPGRPLHVVTVQEMLREKPEKKIDKILIGKKSSEMQPAQIRRPGQVGQRKGGGLGQKKGLGFAKPESKSNDLNGQDSSVKKSNDDFRALFKS